MSSSMRNAIQRRNHKERAQPLERGKWGLLEKHKDYSLRAKDHKEKRKRLKILREKAGQRNPDEFSFKMMSSRTMNGIKIGDRGNKALSHEVVMLLKTQDAGYLRTVLQKTRIEREKAENALSLNENMDGTTKARKLFVNNKEEQSGYAANGDEIDQDDAHSDLSEDPEQPSQSKSLQALRKRERELTTAIQELEIQRAKMTNSIRGVTKNGIKFRPRERKR